MFDIWDAVDCGEEGCPHFRQYPGRAWGDPDLCYPDESGCDIDAPETGRCECMEACIRNMILDGELETEQGYFAGREWALRVQRGDTDYEVDPWFFGFDFSAFPYWWIPDNYAPGEEQGEPLPYKDEAEIYRKRLR
jgi:hypothetical protein